MHANEARSTRHQDFQCVPLKKTSGDCHADHRVNSGSEPMGRLDPRVWGMTQHRIATILSRHSVSFLATDGLAAPIADLNHDDFDGNVLKLVIPCSIAEAQLQREVVRKTIEATVRNSELKF
jgi:hypothetical protein